MRTVFTASISTVVPTIPIIPHPSNLSRESIFHVLILNRARYGWRISGMFKESNAFIGRSCKAALPCSMEAGVYYGNYSARSQEVKWSHSSLGRFADALPDIWPYLSTRNSPSLRKARISESIRFSWFRNQFSEYKGWLCARFICFLS